jgi:SAM-dependent methyltransferase
MPRSRDDALLAGMDPTGRFADRAADYVRFRPDYPAAAIDAVLEGLGALERLVAADVGAGTGISARLLADRGVHVHAIEPNAVMRAAAEPHPHVEWGAGTAEATGLAAASVRLVLCAQAFHWFRQAEAIAEFHRVLEPGGRLALMWNARDRDDPLTLGYIDAIHAVNGEHPAEHRGIEPGVVEAGGFPPLRLLTFPHAQALDLEGFIGRATSASYVSKEPAALAELVRLLTALHARHADARGCVTMRYRTEVHLTERSA